MAVLAAILPLVSQSSALALVLYRLAAADAHVARDLLKAAKAISDLALIVKEVGTIIKEDDRLPSVECATAVANEKQQLETLIIDQQMSIIQASKLYERARPDARFLMENDSSLSLSIIDERAPNPASLAKYQDRFIASLDIQKSDEQQWLASVCGISKSQLDRLLDRWTRLRQFEEDLLDAERKDQAQKREAQQPFVESDSDDDEPLPNFASSGRPDIIPPLFSESYSLPIPTTTPHQDLTSAPVSPRTSISALPVEAAAAVEAKDKDDELDLEIPWTLRTRRYYWKYVDGNVQESNTDAPTSEAFAHRHSWIEVQASWVCKEALQEAGYSHTQVQKEKPDGRRTKFETWFCIDQPLTFDQVQRLVERTVELYRKTQPPSPPIDPERTRRTSFERRHPSYVPPKSTIDRDRTPLAPQGKPPPPPLERSATAYHISQPPPLDRTKSMPGTQRAPSFYTTNPRSSNIQTPPSSASLPQSAPYLPQPIPIPAHPNMNQAFAPASPLSSTRTFAQPIPYQPPPPPPRHLQPPIYGQSPLRTSLDGARYDHYSSTSGTSDSESVTRSRKVRDTSRRRRRGSRDRSERGGDGGRKKKGHGKAGALMGVAGLTALLDGLVGI
ncbi:hypothetical protein SLS60_009358 [Paraconiothyrium brasiliense]|uniref:Uncharacterized protein n=1 Tax=Paraconiothyrium brasiliense TaxID=300254 RepID=A0ABR3QU32_9PLEO